MELPIVELLTDPTELADFAVDRSFIHCPPLAAIPGLKSTLNFLLAAGDKSTVFEILRDRVLAPRPYDGAEYSQFVKKAEWSPAPVSVRVSSKPRCILATLTSSFQLIVYGKTHPSSTEPERWIQMVDVSQKYHEIVQDRVKACGMNVDKMKLEEYKELMYKATCVDFTWLAPFESDADACPKAEAYLITAQANGDILIWHLLGLSIENGAMHVDDILLASVEHTKLGACPGQIISTMCFQWINDSIGLLAVGTNRGSLSLLKIARTPSSGPATTFNFTIGDPVQVLEEDGLQIVSIEILSVPASPKSQKSSKFNLAIVKHPNHVLTKEIGLEQEEVTINSEVQHLRSPQGPIVGVSRHSEDRLVFCHQSGTISAVSNSGVGEGKGKLCSEDVAVQISSDSTPHIFSGLCFSPNKALACVGRQLNCQFHPVNVKEPSRLVVLSSIYGPGAWEDVKRTYMANNSSLRGLTDVLAAFRLHLRSQPAANKDLCMQGLNLRQASIENLRLLLWAMKSISGAGKTLDDETQRLREKTLMLRRINIENLIMQRHFARLVEDMNGNRKRKLPKYELNPRNLRSLHFVQKFLSSRTTPNQTKAKLPPWATDKSVKVATTQCPLCPSVMDFKTDDDLAADLEAEGEGMGDECLEPGLCWNAICCVESQHVVPICVLSLLPVTVQYKCCPTCSAVASFEPAFGQDLVCPFCEEAMESPSEHLGQDVFPEGMDTA